MATLTGYGRNEAKDQLTAQMAEIRRNERIRARLASQLIPKDMTVAQGKEYGKAQAVAEYKTIHDMIVKSGIRNPYDLLETVLEEGYGPQEVQAILSQRVDTMTRVQAMGLSDQATIQRPSQQAKTFAEILFPTFEPKPREVDAEFLTRAFGVPFVKR